MIFDKAFSGGAQLKAADAEGAGSKSEKMKLSELIEALGLKGVRPSRLSEATYFTCLKVLSEATGKMPLKLNQTTTEAGTIARTDHPLYRVCRYRPNPFQSASAFWTSMELSRNDKGNAYAHIQVKGGEVRLWQLPSERVDIWWDNARILSEVPHIWYRWTAPNGKRYAFSEEEVVHLRTWISLDGISGLSVRDILKLTIDGSLDSQQMLNKLYSNGMTGKAVSYFEVLIGKKS